MMIRRLSAAAALLLATGLALGLGPQRAGSTQAAPAASESAASAATFGMDAVHSCALFRVLHLGAGHFYGRFNDIQGTFSFAEGSDGDLSFDVTIPIESVDTNNDSLDGHLKSPDFFNAKEWAMMSFKSVKAVKKSDRIYAVTGDLTIRGQKKRLTVDMHWTGSMETPRGYRCGFETEFTIRRSEFGMMYGVSNGMLGDETKIIVAMEGVRK